MSRLLYAISKGLSQQMRIFEVTKEMYNEMVSTKLARYIQKSSTNSESRLFVSFLTCLVNYL